ncbi:hypothetical protein PLESTB_001208000 [Pleodorina starrii]|uniref:RING-type domain-containing protein n=1 Tax=Pleodorina starrii TaxID=330485 RepID=A0A9W6BSJ4_9CHLO|nr:hypothetical protein PLESTM_001651200 [Pleodorina starrii]GLC57288.1 hypothetical protein PLESTB_001208000 [Pleodorina starrii]GLC71320.1 hypothetical protein PLESTF_001102700 [Pleodorina starrii]
MPSEGSGENGVDAPRTRQLAGAGPSRGQAVRRTAATGRQRPGSRRALQERQTRQDQDVIDLTDDRYDDDEVQITKVKVVKRPRLRSPGGAAPAAVAAAAGAAAVPALLPYATAAGAAVPAPPPAPPSPKGYKCVICLERMESDLATTTCGHMFCYKCISSWVQKSANCPQCRSKLTKNKIIRIYPPT